MVSGSFGGGILSRFENAGGGSFGGTELAQADSCRAIVAGLLIDVLTRLGGASQVDQQPAFFCQEEHKKSAMDVRRPSRFSLLRWKIRLKFYFPVPPTLPDRSGDLSHQYLDGAFRQRLKTLPHAAAGPGVG